MCRALAVLCAAPDPQRLAELKRATVSAHWELVGGATSVDQLVAQVVELSPHVVVIEDLPLDAAARARQASATIRVVLVGDEGGDAPAGPSDARGVRAPLRAIREAILGLPSPGGPVLG